MHLGPLGDAHSCSHSGRTGQVGRWLAVGVGLNIALVVVEALFGWWAGSMALVADAGHNLGDVLGMSLSWWANWLGRQNSHGRWTYGKRGFTMLAAQMNGILLLAAIVGIGYESILRLRDPGPIVESTVITVAAFAVVINLLSAWLISGHHDDLNVWGAYLHMLADAGVSMAVVFGGVLVAYTGWNWVDPALSLAISAALLFSTWQLLSRSTMMMMQAAPSARKVEQIRDALLAQPEVDSILDLHVWNVSTTDVLLTARIRAPSLASPEHDQFLQRLGDLLENRFGISHATIEVVHRVPDDRSCVLDRA